MRNRKQKRTVLAVILAGVLACPLAYCRGSRNPKTPPDLTKGDKPPDYITEPKLTSIERHIKAFSESPDGAKK